MAANWQVDRKSRTGILMLRIQGTPSMTEMAAFVKAHNAAIDEQRGADYHVFCDIREMGTLKPDCAALFQQAKTYSSEHSNFRGSAVWVAGAIVAMQHRRTSVEGGVMDTELISDDEAALWKHLESVYRA